MSDKVILMILDGWGLGSDNPEVSAIAKAKTPFMDEALKKYPHSKLDASGKAVGLPEGQMGNSEVGHMNIGAGRIVYQDLVKISNAIEDGSLADNDVLQEAFNKAKGSKLHFIGLVSDGGVHSHIDHLKGLLQLGKDAGVENMYVHAFTDGRDTDPKSGVGYLKDLQKKLDETNAGLASVVGRYYAMDRDKRWERVKLAYDALTAGKGKETENVVQALQESYDEGVTDEFVKPIIHTKAGKPVATIEEGDVVICFNFRTDRGRQITEALTQKEFPEHDMKPLNLHYVTLTRYDDTFKDVQVIFEKDKLQKTLGETLSEKGKKQIRIAETEKYPHVTFFFNGGREEPFEGEERILCPSPKVATYDMQPEMSAYEIRDKIVPELKQQSADFVCLNFANPDMVGHTGDFDAAVKACEVVDDCTRAVVDAAMEGNYRVIIIADHGNSDYMVNDDGSPNTAHTTNLVPCILVAKDADQWTIKDGKLGDLAPSILKLMNMDIPKEMSGDILVDRK